MNPSPINMEFPNSALANFPHEVDIPIDKMNESKIYLFDDTISSANFNRAEYIILSDNPTAKTGEIHKWDNQMKKQSLLMNMQSTNNVEQSKIFNDDLTTKIFISSITVVGLYIFYKILIKNTN